MNTSVKAVNNQQRLQDERYAIVEEMMRQHNYQEDGLIETLIAVQREYGYLPAAILEDVSQKLDVPLSRVYGVATFYDSFSLEKLGETECLICSGSMCAIAGGNEIYAEARAQAGISGSENTSPDGIFTVRQVPCLGLCDQAPAALTDWRAQVNLSRDDVPALLKGEAPPARILVSGEPRVLTGPIGRLEPLDLAAHRAEGAFGALEKALLRMTPDEVIAEVKESRLTGRGGAGFPTGLKWELARRESDPTKYVVCNFDEAEPGTFKDRAMMEGNPFRVLEGMIIGAYAIGASKGFIFNRGEYEEAAAILTKALDLLREHNLLGDHILGTEFCFEIEIRRNAGAYVCGEETALFEAIEGKRGHPRLKPPYPTQRGLFGRPTSINNVETLAVVPSLIKHGGSWFRQWGTEKSTGLKLFCLSGHVKKPGVIEAPLGLSIRTLIERYGGGFDGEPQALLMGGAAGGFLPADKLDTPLTHEDLAPLDVPIGSGAIMVFNESVDLWQIVEGVAHFFVHETCGHCAPCRLGTQQIYRLLNKINTGSDFEEEKAKLEHLGQSIKRACVCGLGMTAANPSLTVLKNFEKVS